MTASLSKFLLLACLFSIAFGNTLIFSATLEGNQEVQPVATLGEGSGRFEYDTDSKELSYEVSFDFLESGVTAAHIHGPAAVGANGAVLFELEFTEGDINGEIEGTIELTAQQETYLKNGLLYVNFHTNDNANGEIRGQILTLAEHFRADLNGTNVTPTVTTSATGKAKITFDHETLEMEFEIEHDVVGVTAMHFHGPARAGANAPPLITIEDFSDDFDGTAELTLEQALYLRSGLLYLAIHSEAHPNGEIRGQVVIDEDKSDESGGGAWFLTALIVIALIGLVVLVVVGGFFVYKKKGPEIRQFASRFAPKKPASRSYVNMGGVSDEPLLS